MRIDERIASGAEPAFSFEFFPPEDRRGRGEPRRRARRAGAAGPDVRLGHLRRRRHARRSAARRSTSSRASRPTTAWRRWRTSPASARPSTSCARRSTACATPASRTCSRCAATRPRAWTRREWTAADGGLRYSRELIELIRADYDFAIGAACFPEVHLGGRVGRSPTCATPARRSTRARSFLITQLFFDNAALLRLRGPGARRRHRRPDHPGHHADHQRRPDPALHADVRRVDPARPAARARAARRPARGGRRTSASPTRRCSAPTCSPTARPASTSTRSTARPRRARSSARCAAWRPGGAPSPRSPALAVGGLLDVEGVRDWGRPSCSQATSTWSLRL